MHTFGIYTTKRNHQACGFKLFHCDASSSRRSIDYLSNIYSIWKWIIPQKCEWKSHSCATWNLRISLIFLFSLENSYHCDVKLHHIIHWKEMWITCIRKRSIEKIYNILKVMKQNWMKKLSISILSALIEIISIRFLCDFLFVGLCVVVLSQKITIYQSQKNHVVRLTFSIYLVLKIAFWSCNKDDINESHLKTLITFNYNEISIFQTLIKNNWYFIFFKKKNVSSKEESFLRRGEKPMN